METTGQTLERLNRAVGKLADEMVKADKRNDDTLEAQSDKIEILERTVENIKDALAAVRLASDGGLQAINHKVTKALTVPAGILKRLDDVESAALPINGILARLEKVEKHNKFQDNEHVHMLLEDSKRHNLMAQRVEKGEKRAKRQKKALRKWQAQAVEWIKFWRRMAYAFGAGVIAIGLVYSLATWILGG